MLPKQTQSDEKIVTDFKARVTVEIVSDGKTVVDRVYATNYFSGYHEKDSKELVRKVLHKVAAEQNENAR